jgi:hypothetical protein
MEMEALVEPATGHRPRHAVVADDPGCAARWHAVARRLLPGLWDEPSHRSAHARPPPTGRGRHPRARSAVLVVSGIRANTEAARAIRAAAGNGRESELLV